MTISLRITAFILLLLLGCSKDKQVESIDDLNKYAPGVWVGNTGTTFGTTVFWMKYVIDPGGTYTQYYAPASADNWGEPVETGSWAARTSKYSDSGERYFYLELNDNPSQQRFEGRGLETAILLNSSVLQWRAKAGDSPVLKLWIRSAKLTSTNLPTPKGITIHLDKGDQLPFSK